MKKRSAVDKRSFATSIAVVVAFSITVGCRTLNGPYPLRMASAKRHFRAGNAMAAVGTIKKTDPLCDLLERGAILHGAGEYETSSDALFRAESVIEEYDERAVVSGRDAAADISTLVLNEKAVPYRGEGFERVMLHTYLALNHLMTGDIEGARVEVRKTYQRQKYEADRHERKLRLPEQNVPDKSFDLADTLNSVEPTYASTDKAAARVKNAYQNAFAYYMSSIVYELNGEINDAYIDCKYAIDLRPGADCVRKDLVRFARRLNFLRELATWKMKFGDVNLPVDGCGSVVVFFEHGMVPVKHQVTIPIPTEYGIVSTALPIYHLVPGRAPKARVSVNGRDYGRTHILADIEGMAARSLRDRMPMLLVKQAIRATGKGAAMKEMHDNMEESTARLIGSVGSFVTEQADLRGWTTLPRDIQAARVWVEPGRHRVKLDVPYVGGRYIKVPVEKDRITIVNVRSTGGHVYVSVSEPLG